MKTLEMIWQEIGLTINNDQKLLTRARSIYASSLERPQGCCVSDIKRQWWNRMNQLVEAAWRQASSFYSDGEMGLRAPVIRSRRPAGARYVTAIVFDHCYCEAE